MKDILVIVSFVFVVLNEILQTVGAILAILLVIGFQTTESKAKLVKFLMFWRRKEPR